MRWRKSVCIVLSLTLAAFGFFPATLSAGMIDTPSLLEEQGTELRARLDASLTRADVQKKLVAYGVDPADARARVAALTDADLQELSKRIDELPAGGDLIGAAVFVFLVLLLTDILGYTDVFPFVTSTVNDR